MAKTFDKLLISGLKTDAVFFHKPEEPYGFLSNWYPSPFELDGERFSSVEQFIMFRKCCLFADTDMQVAVLSTDNPAKQQEIGRSAPWYNEKIWGGVRQVVAFRGLMAKFSQNKELGQQLLDTGNAVLVECAGSDRVWACGLHLDDEDRLDASKWRGTNVLGYALMEVREAIRRNENIEWVKESSCKK